MAPRYRRLLLSAGTAGVLWLASGLVNVALASSVYIGRVLRPIIPSPTNAMFWSWPPPWSVIALLLAGVSITTITLLVLRLASRARPGGPAFTSAWFAVVAAGALTGLALDAIVVLSSVQIVGIRAIALTQVDYALVGAYWGLVQGWIPALIASRRHHAASTSSASRPSIGWVTVIAVVALVALVTAGTLGTAANQRAIAEEQAAANPTPPGMGAAPDPAAPGSPPPMVAPSPVPRDPSWCTPEQAVLLQGNTDAATGHRVLSIRLMNSSDEPCVVEGYPDVAFADQNGNALDVDVETGSSFMTTDAGSQPIELPSGGYAIAYIGWDANATEGALVTNTVYAAQVAGDSRGSWPMTLDIVEGSTVEITAWQHDAVGPAGDSDG